MLVLSARSLQRKASTTDVAPDPKRRKYTLVDMSDYGDDDHEEDNENPTTPLP